MGRSKYSESLYRKGLISCVISFGVSAASFLLIPVSSFNTKGIGLILAYLVGLLFWGGLICGLVQSYRLGKIRRSSGDSRKSLPAVFRFFSNRYAAIADAVFLMSLSAFMFCMRYADRNGWLFVIILSAAVFSFYLHSVLNGRNFAFAYRKGVSDNEKF